MILEDASAPPGLRTFQSAIASGDLEVGDSFDYSIIDSVNQVEVGRGSLAANGVITRNQVFVSSSAKQKIDIRVSATIELVISAQTLESLFQSATIEGNMLIFHTLGGGREELILPVGGGGSGSGIIPAAWARQGYTGQIPLERIPSIPYSRITEHPTIPPAPASWAEDTSQEDIPEGRIPDTIARKTDITAQTTAPPVEDWAQVNNPEDIPEDKMPASFVPNTGIGGALHFDPRQGTAGVGGWMNLSTGDINLVGVNTTGHLLALVVHAGTLSDFQNLHRFVYRDGSLISGTDGAAHCRAGVLHTLAEQDHVDAQFAALPPSGDTLPPVAWRFLNSLVPVHSAGDYVYHYGFNRVITVTHTTELNSAAFVADGDENGATFHSTVNYSFLQGIGTTWQFGAIVIQTDTANTPTGTLISMTDIGAASVTPFNMLSASGNYTIGLFGRNRGVLAAAGREVSAGAGDIIYLEFVTQINSDSSAAGQRVQIVPVVRRGNGQVIQCDDVYSADGEAEAFGAYWNGGIGVSRTCARWGILYHNGYESHAAAASLLARPIGEGQLFGVKTAEGAAHPQILGDIDVTGTARINEARVGKLARVGAARIDEAHYTDPDDPDNEDEDLVLTRETIIAQQNRLNTLWDNQSKYLEVVNEQNPTSTSVTLPSNYTDYRWLYVVSQNGNQDIANAKFQTSWLQHRNVPGSPYLRSQGSGDYTWNNTTRVLTSNDGNAIFIVTLHD